GEPQTARMRCRRGKARASSPWIRVRPPTEHLRWRRPGRRRSSRRGCPSGQPPAERRKKPRKRDGCSAEGRERHHGSDLAAVPFEQRASEKEPGRKAELTGCQIAVSRVPVEKAQAAFCSHPMLERPDEHQQEAGPPESQGGPSA